VAVAAVVYVVGLIVEREQKRRVQPRLDRAFTELMNAFLKFSHYAMFDYAVTHTDEETADLRLDRVAVLERWRVDGVGKKLPQPRGLHGRAMLIDEGLELIATAEAVAASSRELLPAEIVIAIERLSRPMGKRFIDFVDQAPPSPGGDLWLSHVVVSAAEHLGETLRPHVDADRFKIDPRPAPAPQEDDG
jgi:hypothetical protein